MKIGNHVRKKREALGLNKAELASELQVTHQHVSRIELEQVAPSLELLLKLSRTLGVTTDYLLTGRELAPLDASGSIRAEPDISAAAKRHLIGILAELRTKSETSALSA
jgi:transcriptional regulator with XRE-family HTH domain